MACTPDDIACEVDELAEVIARIAEAQGNDLLTSFATTLIATLVGALIAVWSAWVLARRAERERQDTVLVDHVERLGMALTSWAPEHASHLMRMRLNAETDEPDRTGVDVALDMLVARTQGADRAVALKVRRVVYEQFFVEDDGWAIPEVAAVRRTVVAWAARVWTQPQALAALDTFLERVANKSAAPDIARESIEPRVPDPYPIAG